MHTRATTERYIHIYIYTSVCVCVSVIQNYLRDTSNPFVILGLNIQELVAGLFVWFFFGF